MLACPTCFHSVGFAAVAAHRAPARARGGCGWLWPVAVNAVRGPDPWARESGTGPRAPDFWASACGRATGEPEAALRAIQGLLKIGCGRWPGRRARRFFRRRRPRRCHGAPIEPSPAHDGLAGKQGRARFPRRSVFVPVASIRTGLGAGCTQLCECLASRRSRNHSSTARQSPSLMMWPSTSVSRLGLSLISMTTAPEGPTLMSTP